MVTNKVADFRVVEAAVGGRSGQILFLIRQPGQTEVPSQAWYGQASDWNSPEAHIPTTETYYGHPIIDNGNGWGGINVDVKTLAEVLDGVKRVDLLDMDIQGAEADVVEAGIDALNEKVKLLHIGTHDANVEERIRATLTKAGWQKVWDFPCQSKTETPFGLVTFQDGVQTWKNPRFFINWKRIVSSLFGGRASREAKEPCKHWP
jgi:FkbM family methyltransferase